MPGHTPNETRALAAKGCKAKWYPNIFGSALETLTDDGHPHLSGFEGGMCRNFKDYFKDMKGNDTNAARIARYL